MSWAVPRVHPAREAADGTRVLASDCRDLDAHRDGRGASSNIAIALFGLTWRTRGDLCGFRREIVPRRDSRCHPSCDSPCGADRRREPERRPLAGRAWLG